MKKMQPRGAIKIAFLAVLASGLLISMFASPVFAVIIIQGKDKFYIGNDTDYNTNGDWWPGDGNYGPSNTPTSNDSVYVNQGSNGMYAGVNIGKNGSGYAAYAKYVYVGDGKVPSPYPAKPPLPNDLPFMMTVGGSLGGGMVAVQPNASLTVGMDEYIGNSRGGQFSLGGTNTVQGNLYVAYGSAGQNVIGQYQQSGNSSHTIVNSALYVGYGQNARGEYQLFYSGDLSAPTEYIGYSQSTGTFYQIGATNKVNNLYVGYNSGSTGTYHLTQWGVIQNRTAGSTNGNLIVRNSSGAIGTFYGYGSVNLEGKLTNNGRVIADGETAENTLDLSHFSSSTGSVYHNPGILNPISGGTNGWFAVNKGKLTLPSISVTANGTYYWGLQQNWSGDPDLVNSMKLVFSGVSNGGNFSISLLSPDREDIPDLVSGAKAAAVYNFTPPANFIGSLDLTIRYDDAILSSLGIDEDDLKIFHYQNGSWVDVTSGLDTVNKLIYDDTNIGVGDNWFYYGEGLSGPSDAAVPEPATVISVLLSLIGFTVKRLRRR